MKKVATVILTISMLFLVLVSCNNETYHEHDYSKTWTSDEKNHWHQCASCDSKIDVEAHKFPEKWTETNDEKYKECSVCKYKLVEDTITMTIDEFNKAENIPNWVNNVIIENVDLTLNKTNKTIIGNKNIADFYSYKNTSDVTDEEKKNVIGSNGDQSILTTNKKGYNVILKGGSIKGLSVDNPNFDKQGENGLHLYVPDNSTVIFDGVTFQGTTLFISGQWQQIAAEGHKPEVKYPHIIDKIVLQNCKFDKSGLFQNGGFAKELVIEKCHFTEIENPEYWSNCNPIWFINLGQEDHGWMVDQSTSNLTINECIFETSRPIKPVEQTVENSNIIITNNKFIMKQHELDANPEKNPNNDKRNDVIMFSTSNGNLGNILIENNTVSGDATAFLTFYNPPQITMKEGASFIVKGNKYPETIKDSVVWKTDNPISPDFVQFL